MADNKLSIEITAEDKASDVISVVGTAFEAAANEIYAMAAKTNIAKAAMDALNTVGKAAADSLSQAFGALNIRKSLDIEADKQKLLEAFREIKQSGTSTPEEINRAYAALKSGLSALNAEAKTQMAGISTAGTRASEQLNAAFKALNIRSSLDIEKEKTTLISAFERIKNSGTATADDVAKAQAALKGRLEELSPTAEKAGNTFGGFGVAMVKLNAAMQVAQQIWGMFCGVVSSAIQAVDSYQFSIVKTASLITSFQGKDNLADNYAKARVYAEGLAQQLEVIDQRTIANAHDLSLMTEEMMKQRIMLDVDNQQQVDGFVNIANAVKVVTQGMDSEVQVRQEIRALMQGQVNQNSVLASQVQAMVNGSLKEKVELWKREGTVIENIGGLLTGYAAASGDIQSLWSTITSTMETLYNQVLREGIASAFKEIIALSTKMLEWGKAHKEDLATILNKGWLAIKGIVQAVFFALGGQGDVLKDIGSIIMKIADGWGMICYVLLPLIGQAIGNTTIAIWSMLKVLGNGAEMLLAMFTLDPDRIKSTWDKVQTNIAASFKGLGNLSATNWSGEFDARLNEYQTKIKNKPPIDVPTPKLGETATEQFKEAEQSAVKYQRMMQEELGSTLLSIRKNVADGLLSESDGRDQSLKAEKEFQQNIVDSKRSVAATAKDLFGETSDEYTKAANEQGESEKSLSEKIIQIVEDTSKSKKNLLDTALTHAKNSYQSDLNDLQTSENDKTISYEEAILRRLQLELDYAKKVASLRAQELAKIDQERDPKKYETALGAQLDADKRYLDAKKNLSEEEAKQLVNNAKKAANEAEAIVEDTHAKAEKNFEEFKKRGEGFASGWFGLWDSAYNNAIGSLKNLSDAAYNAFAVTHDMPQKTAESLDALKQKAAEAAENYKKLWDYAQSAGMRAGAAWVMGYRALNMIPAEAARITAEFYNQKVAAEELAIALDDPVNATGLFARNAEAAAGNMKLLDSSTLDKLKNSVQKIKDAILAFTDAVKDSLKSLQDDWDNMSMSKLQLEEKRYNEEKKKWQEDMAKASAQQNADAIAALYQQLDLIEKIHNATEADLKKDPANGVIPGMATGGNVGGSGTGDNQLRWLDPREWVHRPEAVSFWGTDIMAAMNSPWSRAGQFLADRINGISLPPVSIPAPSFAMAGGGPAGVLPSGHTINLNISTTQPIDATFIRRQIVPELDKYARLKR